MTVKESSGIILTISSSFLWYVPTMHAFESINTRNDAPPVYFLEIL